MKVVNSTAKALVALSLSTLLASEALAADTSLRACVTSSGKISIKARCSSKEKVLNVNRLTPVVIAGERGEQGLVGLQGERGATGAQGPKGDRGDVGAQGTAGVQGATGTQGPTGPQGAVGPQGQVGPIGSQGIQGVQGPVGLQGAQGPRGFSAFDVIPSGTTVRGVVGGDFHSSAAGAQWGVTSSLGGLAPYAYSNELVVVRNNTEVDNDCSGVSCLASAELSNQQYCTGTVANPTASPGWICIYPNTALNASSIQAYANPSDDGRYGFFVRWTTAATGPTRFRAVWAYTAP